MITGNQFAISGNPQKYNTLEKLLGQRGGILINEMLNGPKNSQMRGLRADVSEQKQLAIKPLLANPGVDNEN